MSPLTEPTRLTLKQQSVAATDTNIREVSLLLHGNGTNGSTTITDSSLSPKTVTAVGNAQISTAQSKFGGASIAFDGSFDYLTVPASSAFDIESGNFTAEGWFYINANPGLAFGAYRRSLFGNYLNSTSGWSLQLRGNSASYTSIAFGNGDISVIDASQSVSQNTWHHIAVVKNGSACTLYFNGASIGTATQNSFYSSNTNTLFIGAITIVPQWDFAGYIDDLRITKGVARYTANFTPPTLAFPDF